MTSRSVPHGYVKIISADGTPILVPTFLVNDQHAITPEYLVPAFEHDMAVEHIRDGSIKPVNSRGPFGPLPESGVMLAEGSVMVPLNPGHTDAEVLALHAEVMALQQRLGLSYKDAAHRLYMAEVERLKAHADTQKTLRTIKNDLRALGDIDPPGQSTASPTQ